MDKKSNEKDRSKSPIDKMLDWHSQFQKLSNNTILKEPSLKSLSVDK